jgi:hypothetical protein
VALLVDGDNVPPSLSGLILHAAGRLGSVDVRRVYAAEAGFRAWQDALGYRSIQVGGAKNGTDLLLCIEAVELTCRSAFEAIALASDDRDFTHLAHWLRERGLHVLGLGTAKSSAGWRAACSEFEVLEVPVVSSPGPKSNGAQPGRASLSKIDGWVRELILAEGKDKAIEIGRLGGRMGALHKVTVAELAAPNWRAYLDRQQALYKLDAKGPAAQVRWIGPL